MSNYDMKLSTIDRIIILDKQNKVTNYTSFFVIIPVNLSSSHKVIIKY